MFRFVFLYVTKHDIRALNRKDASGGYHFEERFRSIVNLHVLSLELYLVDHRGPFPLKYICFYCHIYIKIYCVENLFSVNCRDQQRIYLRLAHRRWILL